MKRLRTVIIVLNLNSFDGWCVQTFPYRCQLPFFVRGNNEVSFWDDTIA